MNDTNFTLLKSFIPKEPFTVLGNNPFGIYVFQKAVRENIPSMTLSKSKYDFDSGVYLENTNTLSDKYAFSGKRSTFLSKSNQYSATILVKTNSISDVEKVNCIKFKFVLLAFEDLETTAVLSLHKGGKQIAYYDFQIKYNFYKNSSWTTVECHWPIDPEELKNTNEIKFYIWNYKKQIFYADDFEIEYFYACF